MRLRYAILLLSLSLCHADQPTFTVDFADSADSRERQYDFASAELQPLGRRLAESPTADDAIELLKKLAPADPHGLASQFPAETAVEALRERGNPQEADRLAAAFRDIHLGIWSIYHRLFLRAGSPRLRLTAFNQAPALPNRPHTLDLHIENGTVAEIAIFQSDLKTQLDFETHEVASVPKGAVPLRSWRIESTDKTVPDLSETLQLPPLPTGAYLVRASCGDKAVTTRAISVASVGAWCELFANNATLHVADRISGEPLADCEVIFMRGMTDVARTRTNQEGVVRFVALNSGQLSRALIRRSANDWAVVDIPSQNESDSRQEESTANVCRVRLLHTTATPGGRIAAAVLRQPAEPSPPPLSISFGPDDDPRHLQESLRFDSNGLAVVAFSIPIDATGRWQIRTDDKSVNLRGETTVVIDSRPPPPFQLTLESTDAYFHAGQSAAFLLTATSGAQPISGRLQFTLYAMPETASIFHQTTFVDIPEEVRWLHGSTESFPTDATADAIEIASGSMPVTNGRATIQIAPEWLVPLAVEQARLTCIVEAKYADNAIAAAAHVQYHPSAYRIRLQQRWAAIAGIPNSAIVRITDLDGNPIQTTATVSVGSKAKTVQTNAAGIAAFAHDWFPTPGEYEIRASVVDSAGRETTVKRQVWAWTATAESWPGEFLSTPTADYFPRGDAPAVTVHTAWPSQALVASSLGSERPQLIRADSNGVASIRFPETARHYAIRTWRNGILHDEGGWFPRPPEAPFIGSIRLQTMKNTDGLALNAQLLNADGLPIPGSFAVGLSAADNSADRYYDMRYQTYRKKMRHPIHASLRSSQTFLSTFGTGDTFGNMPKEPPIPESRYRNVDSSTTKIVHIQSDENGKAKLNLRLPPATINWRLHLIAVGADGTIAETLHPLNGSPSQ